ncbi:hypothetical protein [Peribacillus frigoritolerans]|uniref:hypothetical protein n=1 Tax=Peribacillus frigoritolerans TaxID=450367 RepID=UPI003305AE32
MDIYDTIVLVKNGKGVIIKTKLFSVSVICILSIIIAMPSFAFAATNAYSFTMNLRIVDGSKNGQYFKLNKGTAILR